MMTASGTTFDTALTRGAVVTLVLAVGWAVTTIGAVAIEAVTDGRCRAADHTGCPLALRLWLLGLFVVLLAGTAAPAEAREGGPGDSSTSGNGADIVLDGLPLPDRVAGGASARRAAGRPQLVIVRPGDSLWRIVRGRLPPRADDAAVAASVAGLYAANRRTIGPDPDRLSPGQRLDFPDHATLPEAP